MYFSTLDLALGFHQVPIHPVDAPKTAFSTPFNHFQYKRMAMGLKGASTTFQALMDKILSGLQGIELFVYMDYIVVYAKSLKQYTENMETRFGRLKTAGLSLQPQKCLFLRTEVLYLGHVISEDGIRPDPAKTASVSAFPQPRNRKAVKQFLGLVGHYRRFITNFAKIALLLTLLLKKEILFVWGYIQEEAFKNLENQIVYTTLIAVAKVCRTFHSNN